MQHACLKTSMISSYFSGCLSCEQLSALFAQREEQIMLSQKGCSVQDGAVGSWVKHLFDSLKEDTERWWQGDNVWVKVASCRTFMRSFSGIVYVCICVCRLVNLGNFFFILTLWEWHLYVTLPPLTGDCRMRANTLFAVILLRDFEKENPGCGWQKMIDIWFLHIIQSPGFVRYFFPP